MRWRPAAPSPKSSFETFEQALAQVAQRMAGRRHAARAGCDTDGPLAPEYRRADLVDTLHREVWGQGFAPPVFSEEVEVVSQRLVGEKHLALKLQAPGPAGRRHLVRPHRAAAGARRCSRSGWMPTSGRACGGCASWWKARSFSERPAPSGPAHRRQRLNSCVAPSTKPLTWRPSIAVRDAVRSTLDSGPRL